MPVKALQINEKQLREQIRDLCKILGWKFYFTWTAIHSPRGMTDLILCRPPRVIFAELKREKQEPTPEQQEWLDILGQCPGVERYVWKPSSWDKIVEILR
jgi:hypothetical protein